MNDLSRMKEQLLDGYVVVCRDSTDYIAMRTIIDTLKINYTKTAVIGGSSGFTLCHEYQKTDRNICTYRYLKI